MRALAGKRVLMLLENSTYPLDVRVRNEALALTGAGYQVSVVCQRGRGEPWREVIDGVRVFRYPAPPQGRGLASYFLEYGYSFLAAFILSLMVFVRPGFDIIHAANPPDTPVFLALFYKLFARRFVFDHHDLAPEMYLARSDHHPGRLAYQTLLWCEKMSFRFADHVIATNQSYKDIAMRRGGVPEQRITIVRNGPALERLRLVQPDAQLRAKARVILAYIGVINLQDGLDYLLRALQQLVSSLARTDFYCVIIGKGSALEELKVLASRMGLDPYVWFTGFIPDQDVLRILSSADICLDPDPANGFNEYCTMIKMMEYMTFAKPVVAFDLPEHRVTAGDAAVYARPNDELDFARQIAALMDDPGRRQSMGQIGRQRIEAGLAWPYQAQHLLAAYQALDLAGRRGR